MHDNSTGGPPLPGLRWPTLRRHDCIVANPRYFVRLIFDMALPDLYVRQVEQITPYESSPEPSDSPVMFARIAPQPVNTFQIDSTKRQIHLPHSC